MNVEIRPCASADDVRQALAPIRHYFGRSAPNEDQAERFTRVLPAERIYAAWESSRAVGGLGAFPFRLTIPGGECAGGGSNHRRGLADSQAARRPSRHDASLARCVP